MKIIALRLKPGQDLKDELEKLAKDSRLSSGFIVTCVGSLRAVTLRMAGAKPEQQDIRSIDGHFEIVSLVGTVSVSGAHLHLCVSNKQGNVIGGHLKQGAIIDTTAEVVVGYDNSVVFDRVLDKETGFEELTIRPV